jgi:Protein of unknown function DUF262/Protein of unknown function (DUF1524)
MATELKPLQEFFNKRISRIPDYQRGYAWGENQLRDFWHDLVRIPEGRNHYTGQLTLEAVAKDAWQKWDEDLWLITGSNFKPYYIVDGQQRLTTAIILIKCLLDRVRDDQSLAFISKPELVGTFLFRQAGVSTAYLFGYEKDNPSYEYLKTQSLGQMSNAFQGTETVYTANLRHASDFFTAQIEKFDLDRIDEFFRRLTQRFVFNEHELSADLDVFVAFETMNNRGKPLSKLELLKNRLIYLSTLLSEGADQQRTLRRNINDAWKTIYEYLGKEKNHPLDDDEFLRAHWIVSFTYARDEAEQFATFLLDEHFTHDQLLSGKLTAAKIQSYVDSIQNAVKAWHAINFPHRAENIGDAVRQGLDRLNRAGTGAFAPLAMAALGKNLEAAEIAALLRAAERFVFLISRLCQRRSNTGDSEFYKLAGQFNRGEKTLTDIIDIIDERTVQHFSIEKAQLEMRELFDRGEGVYSWSGRHYFLFEYEELLKDRAGLATSKISWDEFTRSKKDHVTIEHIYPRSPVAGDWPEFEARSSAERPTLRHSLGNLLALSHSRNSRFSNHAFIVKKQDHDGVRGYYNGSYSEIQVAQVPNWTPEEVLRRGVEMLDFLEQRWRVSLGSLEHKVYLLRLEFLAPGRRHDPALELLASLQNARAFE